MEKVYKLLKNLLMQFQVLIRLNKNLSVFPAK